jgi:hypothetical protein
VVIEAVELAVAAHSLPSALDPGRAWRPDRRTMVKATTGERHDGECNGQGVCTTGGHFRVSPLAARIKLGPDRATSRTRGQLTSPRFTCDILYTTTLSPTRTRHHRASSLTHSSRLGSLPSSPSSCFPGRLLRSGSRRTTVLRRPSGSATRLMRSG